MYNSGCIIFYLYEIMVMINVLLLLCSISCYWALAFLVNNSSSHLSNMNTSVYMISSMYNISIDLGTDFVSVLPMKRVFFLV